MVEASCLCYKFHFFLPTMHCYGQHQDRLYITACHRRPQQTILRRWWDWICISGQKWKYISANLFSPSNLRQVNIIHCCWHPPCVRLAGILRQPWKIIPQKSEEGGRLKSFENATFNHLILDVHLIIILTYRKWTFIDWSFIWNQYVYIWCQYFAFFCTL